MKTNKITSRVSNISFVMGLILFLVNVIGIFNYKTISNKHSMLLDDKPRVVSEKEFWKNVFKNDKENEELYVKRLTKLVSDRMLLIDPKYAKPTFFENWILWIFSQHLGYYEWLDTKKAVRLGGGFCSQHAIVFNSILRKQGFDSRILGVTGHVLNEVLIEGKWKVFDSDYNVVFDASLKELENEPNRIYQAYKNAGRPEKEARNWQKVIGTEADNWHFKSSNLYDVKVYVIETASFFLIWFFPIMFIIIGCFVRKWDTT